MHLTREEQETTINYDASSPIATVYTIHPPTIRKLEKLVAAFPDDYKREKIDRWGGHHYEMPVRLIRFGKPASEAQKEKARIMAQKKAFSSLSIEEKNGSNDSDGGMEG